VVGFAELSHPNYKPTMGGRCIETRPPPAPSPEAKAALVLILFVPSQAGHWKSTMLNVPQPHGQ